MIGLAKSAPSSNTPEVPIHVNQESVVSQNTWQNIPLDIFKFMNIEIFDASDKHISELKDIYEYARSRSNGMPGDTIQKIEELQNRLGEPPIGTSRLSQLTNYIRVINYMSDLRKQKNSLERGRKY